MLADGGHVGLAKHRGAWGALGASPLRFWGPLLTWGVLGTVFFLCFVQYKNLTGTTFKARLNTGPPTRKSTGPKTPDQKKKLNIHISGEIAFSVSENRV